MPNSENEWCEIAQDFETKWNFPSCIGAIDGKHIAIKKPINSGSKYFNYKGFHSIVLMAIADANYKFLYIDIGCYGRISDGGVFRKCSFSTDIEENSLRFPDKKQLPNRQIRVPHVLVADDAFPPTKHNETVCIE